MTNEIRPAVQLTMYELVFPSDLNAHQTMFGGRVVALMDKCAGLCASRWARSVMVTASIDAIQFGVPIKQGQMVELSGDVVFVGNTSCVVKTVVHSQDLVSGTRRYCCQGYFTRVAIDSDGKPAALPQIPVESDTARREWQTARSIKQALLERRRQTEEHETV